MPSSNTDLHPTGLNIEIKARARDPQRQHSLAVAMSDTPPELLEQTDTFFEVDQGRLKLREFAAGGAELIHYCRADQAGPRRSDYSLIEVSDPAGLKQVLTDALGVRGVVRKRRHLYRVGATRIHVDDVVDLGWFLELEVTRSPGQDDEEGRVIARGLMERLEISDADLINRAYVDLLAETRVD